jgi:trimethylamine:corrinoid methyltransferase-like protein
MKQSNIVKFPANKIVREILPNHEEIERNKAKSKQKWAEEVVEDFVANMMDALDNYGITVDGPEFNKDFSTAIDMLRATIYRTMDLPHHLHHFIDNNVEAVIDVSNLTIDNSEDDLDEEPVKE